MARAWQHLQWDIAGHLPSGHAIIRAIKSVTITASGVGSMGRQYVVTAEQGEKHSHPSSSLSSMGGFMDSPGRIPSQSSGPPKFQQNFSSIAHHQIDHGRRCCIENEQQAAKIRSRSRCRCLSTGWRRMERAVDWVTAATTDHNQISWNDELF